MRILLLTNSYPSGHAPGGAAYITRRLRALAAVPRVRVDAVALVQAHAAPVRAVRAGQRLVQGGRRGTALSDTALRLAPGEAGAGYREARVVWGAADAAAVRLGRVPARAIGRAVTAVAALTRGRYDVIHAHGMYALPAGEVAARIAGRLGLPYVVSAHGSDITEMMPRAAGRWSATLAGAAATTYVSAALAERAFALGAPRAAAYVIPNGVDLETFAPAGRRPPGPPRLLFVGNLLPVKGADRLPAVLEAVRRSLPGTQLAVVGDGPLRARIGAQCDAAMWGRVSQARVAELMRESDVLLVPSRSEGWGCVATESRASGTAVVATDVGGLREAVGDGGRLVADGPGVEERLAGAVLAVLADRAAPADLRRGVSGSGWDAVVARELSVLREALG